MAMVYSNGKWTGRASYLDRRPYHSFFSAPRESINNFGDSFRATLSNWDDKALAKWIRVENTWEASKQAILGHRVRSFSDGHGPMPETQKYYGRLLGLQVIDDFNSRNFPRAVTIITSGKANLSVTHKNGDTPLKAAIRAGYHSAVEALRRGHTSQTSGDATPHGSRKQAPDGSWQANTYGYASAAT